MAWARVFVKLLRKVQLNLLCLLGFRLISEVGKSISFDYNSEISRLETLEFDKHY